MYKIFEHYAYLGFPSKRSLPVFKSTVDGSIHATTWSLLKITELTVVSELVGEKSNNTST